jgi:ubiquinone/menaquinone biosynthesis C-methylase UbiE
LALYARFVLPRLIDLVMRNKMVRERRETLIPRARGTVLEIGIGSGLNLPYYGAKVERVFGIDPSSELLTIADAKARAAAFPVQLVCQSAERLPFPDAAIDTVVTTWTLCSIADPAAALREMKRVLKPGGELLFAEHGYSPEPRVAAWQRRLTPWWKRIAGGCHLDRRIDALIRAAGFEIVELQTSYLQAPKPFTYTYEGSARR